MKKCKILSFDRFYEDKNAKTNVDIAIVELFLENLGVEKASSNKEEDDDVDDEDSIEEESSNSTTEKEAETIHIIQLTDEATIRKVH